MAILHSAVKIAREYCFFFHFLGGGGPLANAAIALTANAHFSGAWTPRIFIDNIMIFEIIVVIQAEVLQVEVP